MFHLISGPSRLINDEIVRREIQGEPKWMQRRLREVTYHQQTEGLVPSNPDKTVYSTKKAQVGKIAQFEQTSFVIVHFYSKRDSLGESRPL